MASNSSCLQRGKSNVYWNRFRNNTPKSGVRRGCVNWGHLHTPWVGWGSYAHMSRMKVPIKHCAPFTPTSSMLFETNWQRFSVYFPSAFPCTIFFFLLLPLSQQTACIRRRSDKHIASPPDRTTISREIYYYVLHSRRWLLSKFQSNGLVILFRTRTEASFRNM